MFLQETYSSAWWAHQVSAGEGFGASRNVTKELTIVTKPTQRVNHAKKSRKGDLRATCLLKPINRTGGTMNPTAQQPKTPTSDMITERSLTRIAVTHAPAKIAIARRPRTTVHQKVRSRAIFWQQNRNNIPFRPACITTGIVVATATTTMNCPKATRSLANSDLCFVASIRLSTKSSFTFLPKVPYTQAANVNETIAVEMNAQQLILRQFVGFKCTPKSV